jgi:hypothetical protein
MKYRKKPVVIEALEWRGSNEKEIRNFFKSVDFSNFSFHNGLIITTLEGKYRAEVGDFVIKGVKGEFYPCKPDIFEMTYEEINDET